MTSFVICSIDQGKFRSVTQNIAARMGGEAHEVVGVHDARSLCEGFNRGARKARGESIVFCHDDIEILTPDFPARLKTHLKNFDIIGVAGADRVIGGLWSAAGPPYIFGQIAHPHPAGESYDVSVFSVPRRAIDKIQALDGLFIACRRSVLEKHRFDEQTFDGWHMYDMDFTFGAHLAGLRIGVGSDIHIIHHSVGTPDQRWVHYVQLFNRKYLAQLHPMPQRGFQVAQVRVKTRAEVVEVMTPRIWDEHPVS